MRSLFLNLGTAGATLILLAALTLPASRILMTSLSTGPATAVTEPAAAPAVQSTRVFGAYVDPWHLADWARRLGARPQLVAKFQSFASRRPVTDFLRESERQGIGQVMITWEPWTTVSAALGGAAQRQAQFGYRNVDIAGGAQDEYIRDFAHDLAGFRGTVYLRYAHEMNGYWYPWSRDSRAYVLAWRRVVDIFRGEGARNVRFVWSVSTNLYQSRRQWRRGLSRYWPGSSYVDDVGATVINFGGVKHYTVARFYPTLVALHRMYRKPVILTETNTEFRGRMRWLRDLRRALLRSPWIRDMVWSQLPSRAKVHQGVRVGKLDWDVTRDAPAALALRRLVQDWSR